MANSQRSEGKLIKQPVMINQKADFEYTARHIKTLLLFFRRNKNSNNVFVGIKTLVQSKMRIKVIYSKHALIRMPKKDHMKNNSPPTNSSTDHDYIAKEKKYWFV